MKNTNTSNEQRGSEYLKFALINLSVRDKSNNKVRSEEEIKQSWKRQELQSEVL